MTTNTIQEISSENLINPANEECVFCFEGFGDRSLFIHPLTKEGLVKNCWMHAACARINWTHRPPSKKGSKCITRCERCQNQVQVDIASLSESTLSKIVDKGMEMIYPLCQGAFIGLLFVASANYLKSKIQ